MAANSAEMRFSRVLTDATARDNVLQLLAALCWAVSNLLAAPEILAGLRRKEAGQDVQMTRAGVL